MRRLNSVDHFEYVAARAGIIVFFIMTFDVRIMISPFTAFFYSVFNPALHRPGSSPATAMAGRWLSVPHDPAAALTHAPF